MTTPRPPRLTPDDARTVRLWTIGMLTAATVLVLASPFTDEETDRLAALAACATCATGALVVRRPTGFRVILAIAAVLAVLVVLAGPGSNG